MSDHVAAAARSGAGQGEVSNNRSSIRLIHATNGVAASTDLAQKAIVRGLGEGSAFVRRATRSLDAPATDPRSVWSWLVRASFTLFSVCILSVIVLSSLGLLGTAETMAILGPVVTVTAVIVGVALGDSLGNK